MKALLFAPFVCLMLLSACLQERPAPIEQRGDQFYGRNGNYDYRGNEMPKYSNERRAVLPPEKDAKYIRDDQQQYGISADVEPVETIDLPPVSSADLPPVTTQQSGMTAVPLDEMAGSNPRYNASDDVYRAPGQPLGQATATPRESFLPKGFENDDMRTDAQDILATRAAAATEVSPPAATSDNIRSSALDGVQSPSIPVESSNVSFVWPLRGGVAQHQLDPNGIAISGRAGEPIRAAADGVVVHVGNKLPGFGTMIIIQHLDGYVSTYSHLSDVVVAVDDDIVQGQLIGFVGKSGNTDRPQLGFSIRQHTRAVAPGSVLQ